MLFQTAFLLKCKATSTNTSRSLIQKLTKGDETVLRWIPGGVVEVWQNGTQKGMVKNSELAKGLWSIWFGENSIVNRNNLVSLIK